MKWIIVALFIVNLCLSFGAAIFVANKEIKIKEKDGKEMDTSFWLEFVAVFLILATLEALPCWAVHEAVCK